ncbi:cation-transporting ATPase [Bifidobacterium actinocoloniiforme DSM 22766]|uniref:Cation-transporting ATPase n=1 Tax=Bifidobacterium actinocoloniiforme DSM 22766 TaxID=1437605 RepID=A0A086Z0V2_9BIFI|nr:HAD-IC family P-type ATPase [Bifidobacterium actinocoloniiforme]AKV55344.1 haloacid dehalogenase [Bifidobacterium actinocoloniiforme DSM 22766]KFI40152.1 cation-transporting ATPase [Bifidobacterium actinocoloniiforme DSM 22766]
MSVAQGPTPSFPQVDLPGLSQSEVDERTAAGQVNVSEDHSSRTLGQIIRSNVFTLFNGIILAAMIVVLATGQWRDAVFGVVIIINTGIGVATELKAKRTLDKLSILVASDYYAHRGGRNVSVPHDSLVVGDLLWVRSGDQVPADTRIVKTWGLELDESMLTGESRTVRKSEGEQAYSGSTAVSGLALTEVSAVGTSSYAAKLTAQAKVYKKTHSDLNEGINTILKAMTVVVVPLCILLVWTQMRTVGGFQEAMTTGAWRGAVVSAVAGVVGMIPEGLVLLTSLNFALAAIRLARQNTLVQELESVETLARVDALNLDKTGTITDGGIVYDSLTVLGEDQGLQAPPMGRQQELEQALVDVAQEENPNATGSAILQGLSSYRLSDQVGERVPFSSARKWSAVAWKEGPSWYFGAPEVLLASQKGEYPLVEAAVRALADQGLRVLMLASRESGAQEPTPSLEDSGLPQDLRPAALITCSESIREDAEPTLTWFREQGVRCRIISGDNPATVAAIAGKVKLTGDRPPKAMDARELPSDTAQLARVLEDVDVLGRVLPDQKKAIVQALHLGGRTVAMTGDGVNDSLALKEADLGIAMGNAAPATKAVAQVVLVDSKFSHLPDVVARGRQVMANMERVAGLFLVKTVYSALISLGVVLTAIPFPYLPRHITYIGALTIGMPAFFLALAPNTRRYKPGFLKRVVAFALPGGIATALVVLAMAWSLPPAMGWSLSIPSDLSQLRTVCAIVLFAMGILVLARVAQPLNSWRGVLVALFAAAGVIGAFISLVARFFAIVIPSGRSAAATLVGLIVGCAAMALSVGFLPKYLDKVLKL